MEGKVVQLVRYFPALMEGDRSKRAEGREGASERECDRQHVSDAPGLATLRTRAKASCLFEQTSGNGPVQEVSCRENRHVMNYGAVLVVWCMMLGHF